VVTHNGVARIRDLSTIGFFRVLSENVNRSWAACACASKLSHVVLRTVHDMRTISGELSGSARRPADTG
jgi:hypothetical protein